MTHEELRRAVQELRDADARRAVVPSFAAVLGRARARPAWRVSPVRLALAASLLVASVLGARAVFARPEPAPLRLPREVAALSGWRPITDVLLETPGRRLLRDAAPLDASIINVNITGELR